MTTGARRLLVRLAAGGVLAALLAGVPAMLALGVGWPLPTTVPTWEQIGLVLTQPPTGRLLLNTVAVVAWGLWIAFTVSLTAEATTALRHGTSGRRPHPSPWRGVAGLLLTAAVTGSLGTVVAAHAAPLQTTLDPLLNPPAATAQYSQSAAAAADGTATAAAARADQTGTAATGDSLRHTALWEDPPDILSHTDTDTVVVLVADQRYTVEVVKGDTLWDLADTWLGDPMRWPEIYHLNRDRYDQGGRMNGGHHIEPTWTLVLPDDATPPSHTQPAPAPDLPDGSGVPPANPDAATDPDHNSTIDPQAPPAQPPGATPGPPSQTPPPSSEPSPDDVWAEPDSVITPSPGTPAPIAEGTQSAPPAVDATPSPGPDAGDADDTPAPDEYGGVTFSGGWVALALAASLAAAGAVVWQRRGHRWKPPPSGVPSTQPAEPPLPPTVAKLRRGVRQQAPDLLNPSSPEEAVGQAPGSDEQPTIPPPIGPSGPDLAGIGTLDPAGTALAGPGATAAARGLLVATLSSGGPADPDARGEVIITASTFTDLLGPAAVDLAGTIPRLTVTDNFAQALTHLEELILTRNRMLADRDVADLDTLHATDPLHEPMPPLLLLADVPDPAWWARLSTALLLGPPVQASAVVVGEWPPGHTLHVDSDGMTSEPGQRISVLDIASTIDLLTMLREAHTGVPPAPPELPADRPPAAADLDASGVPASQDVEGDVEAAATPPQPATEDTAMPHVKVDVLGRVAIYDTNGEPVTGLRGTAIAMLIYLAIHRNGANIPDIQEAIWPDATLRRAAERLSTTVANLRSGLRRAAGIAPDQTSDFKPVINTGGRYHLNPTCVDVDWWRLLDSATRAAATTDPAERQAHLEEAVATWNGTFHDNNYDWIESHHHTCRQYGITIHTQLADLLADTDSQRAAELLGAACDINPLNEDVARQAMRAHARLGNTDAIRNRHAILAKALESIDEEPAGEISDLVTDLINQVTHAAHGT